ncbi:MAG: carboxymuconolactone decarboxylase family protein [Promethearchaeota archaeon]
MEKNAFNKRSYTFRTFIKDMAIVMKNMTEIVHLMKHPAIDRKLSERVMLAVTAVNGCRYCSWAHSRMALESGIPDREVKALLGSNFESIDDSEVTALLFAQHYASTGGHPTREATKKLLSSYGIEKTRDILASIYLITVGNLTGNTIDAFESRIQHAPPRNGSFAFEMIVFIIGKSVTRLVGMDV